MRIEEILENKFSPRVSVHMDGVKDEGLGEIAGMLRGLMCLIEGWGSISGYSNEQFETENPIKLKFSSVDNAHYFKSCVEYYLDEKILNALKVKRRVYRDKT